jgi:protein O-mannosyl-transferase
MAHRESAADEVLVAASVLLQSGERTLTDAPTSIDMTEKSISAGTMWAALGIGVATFLLFSRSIETPFFNYDDPIYVVTNPHVTHGVCSAGVKWALVSGIKSYPPYDCGNWHPLTWLSLQADASLWGINDFRGFHLTSIVLHALNSALVFVFFVSATSRTLPSLVASLFWAWHPLRVESVTWVSERKDVLSGFFFLLALFSYLWYARSPCWSRYLLLSVLFVAGLMAKPMVVTLPAVLLLLDYWPLRRYTRSGWLPLLAEKLPLFTLAAISSALTVIAQRAGGAVAPLERLPFGARFLNAGLAYIEYLRTMIWPMPLAPYYPLRAVSVPTGTLAWLALAAITIRVVWARRTQPAALVGWFWYLGTLVPVIGLVQVGSQCRADRYTYLPTIGVLMAVAFSVGRPDMMQPVWTVGRQAAKAWPRGITILAFLVLALLAGATWRQQTYWDNSLWIWQHAENASPPNNLIEYQLAEAFQRAGDLPNAELHYRKAVDLAPRHADSQVNLASVLISRGKPDEAIPHLREAIRLNPKLEGAHQNLAMALSRLGRPEEAALAYQKEIELRPNVAELHEALGCAQYQSGWYDDAFQSFARAAALDRRWALYYAESAHARSRQNRDEARQIYATALKLDPEWPGRAAAEANSLLTGTDQVLRDIALALYIAETVCEATDHRNPGYLELLARAQAANGDYLGAVRSLGQALSLRLQILLQALENWLIGPNRNLLDHK